MTALAMHYAVRDAARFEAFRAALAPEQAAQFDDVFEPDDATPPRAPARRLTDAEQDQFEAAERRAHRGWSEWDIDIVARLAPDLSDRELFAAALFVNALNRGLHRAAWSEPRWMKRCKCSRDTFRKIVALLYDHGWITRESELDTGKWVYRLKQDVVQDERECYWLALEFQKEADDELKGQIDGNRRCDTINPVDNFAESGGRSTETDGGVGGKRRPYLTTSVFNQNPPLPPAPVVSREPGEDDEDDTPQPPAAAPVEHETSAELLSSYCANAHIRHDRDRIKTFCHLKSITPGEARQLIAIATGQDAAILHFNWFKKAIDTMRSEPRRRETPVGGQPMVNHALDRINRINSEPKTVTQTGTQGIRAALDALRRRRFS